ncbi:protein-export chaperone SecB [Candidatus Hydrogenosomobacter endosymbioticus]|uniref:Protein-export protein SecB n=1 Tax=Candidatus Hydrogenosomobacter endosymbioticus TaxID=2558174 RepID=A0ABN6L3L3_9PROT|nr:protein-export chaperone SecB [Candidatus Hydrogenosomobacter endosymbioticus]BDB96117.1 protein-export protein SecB [Candidatus Hydrogenosomobacter endosymbioticus]
MAGKKLGSDEMSGKDEQLSIEISLQYIKDLSFENPSPVKHLLSRMDGSAVFDTGIGVDVGYEERDDGSYEVVLSLRAQVREKEETVYLLDLKYAGVFKLSGVKDGFLELILLIECPRLLFPFARAVISGVTRDSGFPSLDLQPIDFADVLKSKIDRSS